MPKRARLVTHLLPRLWLFLCLGTGGVGRLPATDASGQVGRLLNLAELEPEGPVNRERVTVAPMARVWGAAAAAFYSRGSGPSLPVQSASGADTRLEAGQCPVHGAPWPSAMDGHGAQMWGSAETHFPVVTYQGHQPGDRVGT